MLPGPPGNPTGPSDRSREAYTGAQRPLMADPKRFLDPRWRMRAPEVRRATVRAPRPAPDGQQASPAHGRYSNSRLPTELRIYKLTELQSKDLCIALSSGEGEDA